MKCSVDFMVAGPHEGCAEFAAPDMFECSEEAVVKVTMVYDPTMMPGEENVIVVHLCMEHEIEFDNEISLENGLIKFTKESVVDKIGFVGDLKSHIEQSGWAN